MHNHTVCVVELNFVAVSIKGITKNSSRITTPSLNKEMGNLKMMLFLISLVLTVAVVKALVDDDSGTERDNMVVDTSSASPPIVYRGGDLQPSCKEGVLVPPVSIPLLSFLSANVAPL